MISIVVVEIDNRGRCGSRQQLWYENWMYFWQSKRNSFVTFQHQPTVNQQVIILSKCTLYLDQIPQTDPKPDIQVSGIQSKDTALLIVTSVSTCEMWISWFDCFLSEGKEEVIRSPDMLITLGLINIGIYTDKNYFKKKEVSF